MFEMEELKAVDPKYFNIILLDPYDVSIQSRNTGHYWSLHSPEYPDKGIVIIFHSHRMEPFHAHGRANSLRQAVKSIQSHDRWQMKGRPRRR